MRKVQDLKAEREEQARSNQPYLRAPEDAYVQGTPSNSSADDLIKSSSIDISASPLINPSRRQPPGPQQGMLGVQPGGPGMPGVQAAPGYQAPQPGMPGYQAPQPGMPGYQAPQPGMPGYQAPQPGMPGYQAPQPGMPDYQVPQPGMPGYQAPQPGTPGYQVPQPRMPGYQAPQSGMPGYQGQQPGQYGMQPGMRPGMQAIQNRQQMQYMVKNRQLVKCDMKTTPGYEYLVGTGNEYCVGCLYDVIGACCGTLKAFLPVCGCCLCCVKDQFVRVDQGSEALVYRFKRLVRKQSAGLIYINPCSEHCQIINMKVMIVPLERQVVLSKDYMLLRVSSSINLKILEAEATVRQTDIVASVREFAMAVIKNTFGVLEFQQILQKKQLLEQDIERQVDKMFNRWGLDVDSVYITEVQFMDPHLEIQLISKSVAERNAAAKLLNAQGELKVAGLLKQTSQALNSQAAMNLRWVQSIQSFINKTTVFFSIK